MKKQFLKPFALLAAAMASDQALAAPAPAAPDHETYKAESLAVAPTQSIQVRQGTDLLRFVLKRNGDTGVVMADHESHASHASHASHSSHASGY